MNHGKGTIITPHYDPLLMKIIVHGNSRPQAIKRMEQALKETTVAGFQTNIDYLHALCTSTQFKSGEISTELWDKFDYESPNVEVLKPEMYSTLQNWPGCHHLGQWIIFQCVLKIV